MTSENNAQTGEGVRDIRLPDPADPAGDIVWHLTDRGLEWTGGSFTAGWMPFACMRRVALGGRAGHWTLRVSGPPGAIQIIGQRSTSDEAADMAGQFLCVARHVVQGAAKAGGRTQLRYNPAMIGPGWIWARVGGSPKSPEALLALLDPSPT